MQAIEMGIENSRIEKRRKVAYWPFGVSDYILLLIFWLERF